MMTEHTTNIEVGGIIHRGRKVFLARRAVSKANWPGRLEYIGGHLEVGEALQSGLQREVLEEIGVKIKVGQLVDAYTHRSSEVGHPFKVKIVYLCEFADDQEPILGPNEHSEFIWIDSKQIELFGDQEEETQALKKAFTILEGDK